MYEIKLAVGGMQEERSGREEDGGRSVMYEPLELSTTSLGSGKCYPR